MYKKQISLYAQKTGYLTRLKMLDTIQDNGIFLLNTNKNPDQVLATMNNNDKRILQTRKIKMFIVDADKIAREVGLPGKISTIIGIYYF